MNRHRIEGGWMRCKGLWRSWVGRLSGNEFEVLMGECDRLDGVLRQHQGRSRQRDERMLRELQQLSAPTQVAR